MNSTAVSLPGCLLKRLSAAHSSLLPGVQGRCPLPACTECRYSTGHTAYTLNLTVSLK